LFSCRSFVYGRHTPHQRPRPDLPPRELKISLLRRHALRRKGRRRKLRRRARHRRYAALQVRHPALDHARRHVPTVRFFPCQRTLDSSAPLSVSASNFERARLRVLAGLMSAESEGARVSRPPSAGFERREPIAQPRSGRRCRRRQSAAFAPCPNHPAAPRR
jgi:hypothetical protein